MRGQNRLKRRDLWREFGDGDIGWLGKEDVQCAARLACVFGSDIGRRDGAQRASVGRARNSARGDGTHKLSSGIRDTAARGPVLRRRRAAEREDINRVY